MAKVLWVAFSAADWITGTLGMTLEEEGLYSRMIARYYARGEALPSDPSEIAKICQIRPQVVRRLLPKLMAKFVETGGKLRQNRCETEIKLALNRRETARFNGSQPKKNKHLAEALATSLDQSHQQEEKSPLKGRDFSIRDAIASTTAFPPPMGDAVGLIEWGTKLLGNETLIRQQVAAVGPERVNQALNALQRKEPPPQKPVAYFVACCRGPEIVASNEEIKRHAAEELERARLECYREAGICLNDRG